jgi:hypothetical protein
LGLHNIISENASTQLHFQVGINSLWPGQKLKAKSEGETRWGTHTAAWRTETHTPESFCQRVTGDGYSFCAVLKQPWRISGNFESLQVLATDHDSGADLETLLEDPLIRDKCAFLYETPSSNEKLRKFRAAFILDHPITDGNLATLAYRALIWHFSDGAPDAEADRACKDPVRFFYGRPNAPHWFLGNIFYRDELQDLIDEFLTSGTETLFSPTPTPVSGVKIAYTQSAQTGQYDPHRGPRLAESDQQALARFLTGKGLKLGTDGRFNGPCPLHPCVCPGAAYFSAPTGNWYCFCSDHPGRNYGTVGDLEDVGFILQHARESAREKCPEYSNRKPYYYIQDTRQESHDDDWKPPKRGNLRRSPLWDWCRSHFPSPPGVRPKCKSAVLLSKEGSEFIVGDLYSTSWFNRANEAFKKATLLQHLIKTFSKADCFSRCVPFDDWTEKKHEALTKAVERRGGRYYLVDNADSRGYMFYLATKQAPGFELVEDLPNLALEAVQNIRVPDRPPENGRFRPTRSSQALGKLEDKSPDDDAGKFELVASKKGETDWAQVEAELRELNRRYEWTDPVFRAMPWQGIRGHADPFDPYQDLMDIFIPLGYSAHKKRQKMEVGS